MYYLFRWSHCHLKITYIRCSGSSWTLGLMGNHPFLCCANQLRHFSSLTTGLSSYSPPGIYSADLLLRYADRTQLAVYLKHEMIITYHRPLIRSSAAAFQVFRCRRAGHLCGHVPSFAITRRCTAPDTTHVIQRPFFNIVDSKSKKKEYSEQRLIGYSMEQMFDVVADVGKYNTFVPWCTRSQVLKSRPGYLHCKLTIGFAPLNESYKSTVTLAKPNLVRSECVDGRLFNYLLAVWQFSPGLEGKPKSCTLHFSVSFEFRSALHSHVAEVFFNEVVRKNVEAFLGEARRRYGPPSIPPRRPLVNRTGTG